jgi:7-carboxy-7-deazaguanine synthase
MSMIQQSTMLTSRDRGLPIAETFHSIMGEGTYVGTPMHFIRLSGCPVGSKATQELVTRIGNPLSIPSMESNPNIRASYCKTWDGRNFVCDTDFSCHTYKTVDELIGETWEKHICLTGGEPLIHQQSLISLGFFQQAFQKGIQIHIETSGTIVLSPSLMFDKRVWITVSPKWGWQLEMVALADEVKFLVDQEWDEAKLEGFDFNRPNIFVSPINGEKEVNQENVQIALAVLHSHPTWRLSCQWHKFLNLR